MLTRDESINLIQKYLKDNENIKIALAMEILLGEIARRLNKPENVWSMAGLLHNIDYEYSVQNPEKRGVLSSQILDGLLPEDALNAIKANNYMYTDYIPVTTFDKCMIASESLTHLIFYIVDKTSSNKIKDIEYDILFERYNDKSFASHVNRSRIELCTDIGIDVETFMRFTLDVLKVASTEIGL